jgi:hypothetical protein
LAVFTGLFLAVFKDRAELLRVFYSVTTPHSWANSQKPAKVKVEKFVKLTDHTYVCNDLTSFEYEAHTMTGNGSYLKMLEFAWKNL